MRTTRPGDQTKHLANSRAMFLDLLALARAIDIDQVEAFRSERDYEGLERYILEKLMGQSIMRGRQGWVKAVQFRH